MRRIHLLLAVCALAFAGQSSAGTLYRCEGSDGTTYSGVPLSGMRCKVMSTYKSTMPAAAAPIAKAEPAPSVAAPASAAAAVTTLDNGAPVPTLSASGSPTTATSPRERRVSGAVYSYMRDGIRYVTSTPPRGISGASVRTIRYSYIERCFACDPASHVNFRTLALNTNAYRDEISTAARVYGVEEAIIRAIMHAESAYNPRALSRVGAQGLMQLMPATARRFGVSNAFDPADNIKGGVQYLAWLAKRFNGDLTRIAAGYNAGEGAVDKYGGVPPYSETRAYVQRVNMLAERYRSQTRN